MSKDKSITTTTPKHLDHVGVSNISQEFADNDNRDTMFKYRYIGLTINKKKHIVQNIDTGELTIWAYVHILPEAKKEYRIKSLKATMKALLKRGYEWDDNANGFVSTDHDFDFIFDSDDWTYCGMKVESIEAAAGQFDLPKWLVEVTEIENEENVSK